MSGRGHHNRVHRWALPSVVGASDVPVVVGEDNMGVRERRTVVCGREELVLAEVRLICINFIRLIFGSRCQP